MAGWEESRNAFIQKMKKAKVTLEKILERPPERPVFSAGERSRLEGLMERNDKILTKLEKGEFTVAIVGLEKAGKSTLGNALLKDIFLPEYTERCTYTTTKIKAGTEDSGEIIFYTYEEFNADFQKMMTQIGYEGSADMNMPLDTFNAWWQSMEERNPDKFERFNGTTVEDIRFILRDNKIIREFLGTPKKTFRGAESLRSRDFRIFITGISEYDRNGVAVRTAYPYAVKRVNISSTMLGDMAHIVLYDVPGFDSPTDLHKKQTEEMLQAADAIILVTNVGDRPNLVGTQLDMLCKGRDEDNISLAEKAFVFGNKVDRAGNEKMACGNMAALCKDATDKYRIARPEHIVCGSAKAYLEGLDKWSEDEVRRGKVYVRALLEEWALPDGDGIDTLQRKMKQYYETERYAVLRKRAENTLHDAEKFLREVLEKNSGQEGRSKYNNGARYVLEIKNLLPKFFEEAKIIGEDYKKRIWEERPFSALITEYMAEIYPNVDEAMVQKCELRTKNDVAHLYNVERVDTEVREELQVQFAKRIVQRTAKETGELEEEIYEKLVKRLLDIVGMQESSPYYSELKADTRRMFTEILEKHDGENCRFNTLVERFTTSPIEAVIKCTFGGDTRYNKLIEANSLPQFFSLAAYYQSAKAVQGEEVNLDDEAARWQVFSRILLHEDFGKKEEEANEAVLRALFEESRAASANPSPARKEKRNIAGDIPSPKAFDREPVLQAASAAVDFLPFGKWAKLFAKTGIHLGENTDMGRKALRQIKNIIHNIDWQAKSQDERMVDLDAGVHDFCSNVPLGEKRTLQAVLLDLHHAAQAKKARKNDEIAQSYPNDKERNEARKAQMIADINDDIAILRDLTIHAVVRAIDLEMAFISVIMNNIDLIRGDSQSETQNLFDAWIENNVVKLREAEYVRLERDSMEAETRRNIIDAAEKLLYEMEA
ncbi:dynamin family protein [uncultured Selenomonas sp.]|uniref:dynamin family protein n=1 Tax=uncultured Selenomonas sp. TaxID=159275 RepID=UPI0028DB46AC|nr:dynamin family protein [uncultured Selenomonas sp.]